VFDDVRWNSMDDTLGGNHDRMPRNVTYTILCIRI
jgi:hypothetical protein